VGMGCGRKQQDKTFDVDHLKDKTRIGATSKYIRPQLHNNDATSRTPATALKEYRAPNEPVPRTV
jgi:hypothetical protein